MIGRETIFVDRGAVYAIAGRRWQLPGLAGRLRAVRYVGEQADMGELAAPQHELAAVVRLYPERRS